MPGETIEQYLGVRMNTYWLEKAQHAQARFSSLEADQAGSQTGLAALGFQSMTEGLLKSHAHLFSFNSSQSKFEPPWMAAIHTLGLGPQGFTQQAFLGCGVLTELEPGKPMILTARHVLCDPDGVPLGKEFLVSLGDNEIQEKTDRGKLRVTWVEVAEPEVDLVGLSVTTGAEPLNTSPLKRVDEAQLALLIQQRQLGVIFGWGRFNPQWDQPDLLIRAEKLRDVQMELFRHDVQDSAVLYCDSFDDRGPCRGDSGGPMLVLADGKARLAGIVLGRSPGGGECHNRQYPTRFLLLPATRS